MTSTYLVTGALGNVGASVVGSLLERELRVLAAGPRPASISERFGGAVEAVLLDYRDPTTFDPSLEGVDSIFLIRPPAISRVGPSLNRFIDAVANAGIGHIVFSSVAGADTNRIVPHHRIEQHIFASGVGWTVLRPGFFSQNIGTAYRRDIVEDDRIFLPAGDGRAAFIDARDIGEIAALTMVEAGHTGKAFHLTGSEAIGFGEVAEILTSLLGRAIDYQPTSVPGYHRHLRRQGLVTPHAVVQTLLHAGLRRGDAEPVTDAVERLIRRPPRTVEEYIEDHVELWASGS